MSFFDVATQVLLICIVLATSVRTVLDILEATGLTPEFLSRLQERRRIADTKNTLTLLGLGDTVEEIRSARQVLAIRPTVDAENPVLREHLNKVVHKNVEGGGFVIGSSSQKKVKYFVNLRRAFCESSSSDSTPEHLTDLMLAFIRNEMRTSQIRVDMVVGRRHGLDVLAFLIARCLRVPCVLHSASPSVWESHGSNRDERDLDYSLDGEAHAIIVDDSCFGGGDFRDIAADLKRQGHRVTHAFVLFNRGEADSVGACAKDGIRLHALATYSDADIAPYAPIKNRGVESSLGT